MRFKIKNDIKIEETKKIMQPFGTKKNTQHLGTKKTMQPLGTKKSGNLFGQKNKTTSQDTKIT